jgi:hypothetical protein
LFAFHLLSDTGYVCKKGGMKSELVVARGSTGLVPGRFARKVSRFVPLNRYYILIDEVFFENFLVIISCIQNKVKLIKIYDKQRI